MVKARKQQAECVEVKRVGGNMGIYVEGQYFRRYDSNGIYWILKFWRLDLTASETHPTAAKGEWHKLSGNQKKPLASGALPVRIDGEWKFDGAALDPK